MNKKTIFDVKNKKIIISGCSGLLGLEFSKSLLSNGAIVIGLDIKKPKIKNKNFYFFNTNLNDKISITINSKKINKKFKKIDCLINNAAINEDIKINTNNNFLKYKVDNLDEFININIKSIMLLAKVFYKNLKTKGGGSIINIGSVYGLVSPDHRIYNKVEHSVKNQKNVSYTITKSALIGLTKHLAVIFAKDKIRVNSTSFGGVLNNQNQNFIKKYKNKTLLNRLANKDEYNGIINFLVSDASTYATGSNFVIDGGLTSI